MRVVSNHHVLKNVHFQYSKENFPKKFPVGVTGICWYAVLSIDSDYTTAECPWKHWRNRILMSTGYSSKNYSYFPMIYL